jgi:hypothetical protein
MFNKKNTGLFSLLLLVSSITASNNNGWDTTIDSNTVAAEAAFNGFQQLKIADNKTLKDIDALLQQYSTEKIKDIVKKKKSILSSKTTDYTNQLAFDNIEAYRKKKAAKDTKRQERNTTNEEKAKNAPQQPSNSGRKTQLQSDYEVLGISEKATDSEVKTAYKKLSLVRHPDKPTGSKEAFQELQAAYERIKSMRGI